MKLSRALLPAALTGALLLAGCTSSDEGPTKDASGADCLAAGDVSREIAVEGTTGDDLKLSSETPVAVEEMQRSVLKPGDGDVVTDDQQIAVSMTLFNGANGESLEQVPETVFSVSGLSGWADELMRCAVPGQQAVLVAPYADMFGETTPEELGVENLTADDSVVVVMEFGEAEDAEATAEEPGTLEDDELLSKAEGTAKDAPEGFPTVELADDGSPTITIPEGVEAPGQLQIATLIEGDGEEVQAGDRVYVNYRGVIWRTGEEFDSSWSKGAPANFTTDEVIGGFSEALVGQKVGSQVISVVPAEDGGYGASRLEEMGYEPDDVMVFVLDILGTVHAEAAE